MPATSGGRNASAKRSAGAAFDSGVPDRFDLIAMATRAIVAATTASANQIRTQRNVPSGGAGDGRGDERAQAHEDPAPAGDGGELGGPRHGLADEAQVLERVRLDRLWTGHQELYSTEGVWEPATQPASPKLGVSWASGGGG